MPLITWNEKFSVGISSIDSEHQELVGLLNGFYDAVQSGKGKESLDGLLSALIDYTKFHFANEERLFTGAGYPDAPAHKKLHQDLIRQIHDLEKKFSTGANVGLALEAVNFLKSWLLIHIQGTDKKYAPHLIAKGIH
jgi:hemerythrin